MISKEWMWPPWSRVIWGRTMPDKANEDYMWPRINTKGNGSMGRIGMNSDLTEWENMWCTAGRGRDSASQTGSEEHDEGNNEAGQLQKHEDEREPEEATKEDDEGRRQRKMTKKEIKTFFKLSLS
mgnify:CR=1 FL=1